MTQLALPEAIVPDEDFRQNRRLTSGGVTFTLSRKGDEFWVNTPDPDREYVMLREFEEHLSRPANSSPRDPPPDPRKPQHAPRLVDRQVVLVTGSHNMQMYWLPSEKEGAPLRLFPWIYQIRDQRWMPYEDSFLVHPDFGRPPVSWNDNCIACHSLNGEFTYTDESSDPRIKSTVAEFGISCEACHGPGRDHVRKHQNPLARYQQHWKPAPDPTIINPAKAWHVRSAQICGQCHSTFDKYGPYRAGDNVNESRAFVRHVDARHSNSTLADNYWDDGSVRIGGREYMGLTESPCYQKGKMSCTSCHSMHDSDPKDQLAQEMSSDHACLQCHTEMQNRISEHTYHPAESAGSRCYNCHMPHTAYALLGAIRNHRIDSPSVANHVRSGHPNACNLCHLDKTLQWTSEHLSDWYGQPSVELDPLQQTVSPSVQLLLSGDAVQRIVVAWHMGWEPAWETSGKDWQAPILAHLLQDPYAAVRYVTHKSMQKLPGQQQLRGKTEYDFIAPEADRQQFQLEFLKRWQANKPTSPENPETVLWNPDGTLQADRIQSLLKQRDDRKILLAE